MGTKSLTITEEAYERLKAHKREDESFTDTILRLAGSERDPMVGFGAMRDVDGFREAVGATRGDLDEDLRRRADLTEDPRGRNDSEADSRERADRDDDRVRDER